MSTDDAMSTEDRAAYLIAVGAVGCALIVVLTGVCVIVAVGVSVPEQLWTTVSTLGGGLLGIIAPSPTPSASHEPKPPPQHKSWFVRALIKCGRGLVILGKDLWNNRAIVILLVIFGTSIALGASEKSTQWQALAGASAGALIGMLAPSPTKAR